MATLTGSTPANTYQDLFRLVNAGQGLDDTLRNITGGNGVPTTISVSDSQVQVDFGSGEASNFISNNQLKKYSKLGNVSDIKDPAPPVIGDVYVNIPVDDAEFFSLTLNEDIDSINFLNTPSGLSIVKEFYLEINVAGAPKTVSWPSSNFHWDSNGAPVFNNDNFYIIKFLYIDDGVNSKIVASLVLEYV